MVSSPEIQHFLFNSIRNLLPPHLSLAEDVSEVLGISSDSTYRRIRGEKELSLNEVVKLAVHYGVSIDNMAGIVSGIVPFQTYHISEEEFTFEAYLETILSELRKMKQMPELRIIFILNEINLFHILQIPELTAFKIYFWGKSSFDFKNLKDRKFTFPEEDSRIVSLSQEISSLYTSFDTIELLTDEFLSSFVKQILFYVDSGYFEKRSDAELICAKGIEMIEHLRSQAETGHKYLFGKHPESPGGRLQLYYNDLTLIDNTIIVCNGNEGVTFLTNGAVNLLATHNRDFYLRNLEMAKILLRKSTLISDQAERERNIFFNSVIKRMNEVKCQLSGQGSLPETVG